MQIVSKLKRIVSMEITGDSKRYNTAAEGDGISVMHRKRLTLFFLIMLLLERAPVIPLNHAAWSDR